MDMEVGKKLQKSYFDVLGLCCPSEIPLIESVLKQLNGINEYSVLVPTKTVIVVHDSLIVSQIEIVKALNQARLEANIRVHGEANYKNKWPSPYAIASGVLLLLSFLKYFYSPLRWLAVGAVAVGTPPIALKAVAALRNYTLDINLLVLITVAGSIALHDYWEAGTIVFLFTISDWLESRASHKATAVMSSLANVVPQRAVLADTGEEIDADEVKLNTILAVKAGEVIPIDGIVVEGSCEVDEKVLTGESFPVPKQKDSIVWASTINLNGYISIKTTAVAEDCVVARMAKIVEEAQNNKSRTQRFMDKCAKYYTPAIVVISALIAIVPLAFHLSNKRKWYHLALVVLVSGCPCALLLSTPVAMFCALSKAATLGVLFKGAEHLENLAKIKVMAFDKTGTVTRGEFQVVDFKSVDGDVSFNELLYWVSSIECKSSHPMAEALVDYARQHSIEPRPESVEQFENFPGEGIYGKIEGNEIYIGNKKIASKSGCSEAPSLEGYDAQGKSVGYVFMLSSLVGIFSLSDMCRTGAKEAIRDLKSMGIKTVMLTGDCRGAADRAQEQLDGSLDQVRAELLPEDKAQAIKDLQRDGPTAMIGDGLNDAPALAIADLGVSMGVSGSALATETGDIVLMSNDLQRISQAYKLSKKARRKIYENVALSISTKAGILGLAIAGHPLVWAAVLVDVGTCLLVIFNSMLLLRSVRGKEMCRRSKHHHHHGCETKCGSTCSHSTSHEHKHSHCSGKKDSHCHGHDRAKPSHHNHSHENKHCEEIITSRNRDKECCTNGRNEEPCAASKNCDDSSDSRTSSCSDHKKCSSRDHSEDSHRHAHSHDRVSSHNGHCHGNYENVDDDDVKEVVTLGTCDDDKCCNGFERKEDGSGHCSTSNNYKMRSCSDRVDCGNKCCSESFRQECCRRNGDPLTRLCEIVIE